MTFNQIFYLLTYLISTVLWKLKDLKVTGCHILYIPVQGNTVAEN